MGTTETWSEYVAWLAEHVPAAHANLAPGATDETIAALERDLGVELPEPVRAVWRINDGQVRTMVAEDLAEATPCLPTLSFLSTAMVARVWRMWEEVRRAETEADLQELHDGTRSAVPGVVRALYTSPRWIPLWADPTEPDYVGLDLDPGEAGRSGQLINFGRNEDRHFQLANDFDDLLAFLLDEVRSGRWQATEMDYGDKTIPWFGAPGEHFFNALHGRWKARNRRGS